MIWECLHFKLPWHKILSSYSFYLLQKTNSRMEQKPLNYSIELQLTLDNSNTRKLEHLVRLNKFIGHLDEFLSMTQTFPYLSKIFQ